MPARRRPTTITERLTPCLACGFPLVHRHHILEFSQHGDHLSTWPLCASCHELLHLALDARIPRSRASVLWRKLLSALGPDHPRISKIIDLAYSTQEIHWEDSLLDAALEEPLSELS